MKLIRFIISLFKKKVESNPDSDCKYCDGTGEFLTTSDKYMKCPCVYKP